MPKPPVKIVTDSTCDLPPELIREYGITVVPVTVHIGQSQYLERVEVGTDELFKRLAEEPQGAADAHTSPPAVLAFEQVYRRLQRERPCDGIVSIHVSAKLSGTYNAALMAREAFMSSALPLSVVDTMSAGMGLGLIVLAAARAAHKGASWSEVVSTVQRMIPQTHVAFMVDSLEYLQRSGRIANLAPMVDSLLPLKPLLRVDEGQIVLFERTRTRYKAIEALFSFVEDFPHVERLVVLYVNNHNDANNLAERCAQFVPRDKISVQQYGPANALTLGRGALGVAVYEG